MAQDDAQADGYYAEDDMGADELDLSFLDENEEKGDASSDTLNQDGSAKK